MIGVFARMFGGNARVSEVTESETGLEVKAHEGAVETSVVADDAPPKAFVEKVEYDGGNVYVIPFMEAFRAWIQRRKGSGADDDAQEGAEAAADGGDARTPERPA